MNQNKLQQYFPTIRTRQEILDEIKNTPKLFTKYKGWKKAQREEFLDFVTGVKGVKVLYDTFFKEILNPETVPGRLDELLSLLLGRRVHILSVLAPESRLGDEQSLVIMDIIVKLEDGAIVDVEVQKVGYKFPGQRGACYSADMLLRQYKAAREQSAAAKKTFSYYDVHDVYTIVFYETSPREFHEFPAIYFHRFGQKSDTGLEMELLQKYLFIPLDIFRENLHNKGMTGKLDAWLAFLSCDEPEIIMDLIVQYPEFRFMYEHIYNICQNMERVMEMFSEELRILDRNTVQLMIEEQEEELKNLTSKNKELADKNKELTDKLNEQTALIAQLQKELQDSKNSAQDSK